MAGDTERPTIRVAMTGGEVVTKDIEDYVSGVVLAEVYATWPVDVLKAQAVAARTYALAETKHHKEGFDVCTSPGCCQAYTNKRAMRVDAAVAATMGVVLVDQDSRQVFKSYYSASCGGSTVDIWDPAHLRAMECPCGLHGHSVKGHRHGFCQWGAYYLVVDRQYDWRSILMHYYKADFDNKYGQAEEEPPSTIEERVTAIEKWIAGLEEYHYGGRAFLVKAGG